MLDKFKNERPNMKIIGIDRLYLFTYKNADLEEYFEII